MKNTSLKKPSFFHGIVDRLPNDLGSCDVLGPDHVDRDDMKKVFEDLDCLVLSMINDRATTLMTTTSSVGLKDFQILKLVGRGSFGKVYQVRKKDSSEIFAMKVMRKDKTMRLGKVRFVHEEKEILARLDHPFMVHLRYSFHTKYRLYLVLDYVGGGELYFHLQKEGLFLEDHARLYTAEIVSAVSHLHENGIMHRDIKSGNVMLDFEGHVVLVDFGLAKQSYGYDKNPTSDAFCGTTGFMAPEIVVGETYDRTVDWWSVGILLFEMLTGKVPFRGNGPREVVKKIAKGKIKLPGYLTREAHSLLKGLLTKDPSKRLGRGGGEEIKRHKWFGSIDWKKLEAREIRPSFVPRVGRKQSAANFSKDLTNVDSVAESQAKTPRYCSTYQVLGDPFKGFSNVRRPKIL